MTRIGILVCVAALGAAFGLSACRRDALPMAKNVPAAAQTPVTHAVNGQPGYVGRWAVSQADCAQRAWVFSPEKLQTPGPFTCDLSHVEPTTAGYSVNGTCTVGAASAPTLLNFTLTRFGGPSLTVSGGPFPEPVALGRCRSDVHTAEASTSRQG